MVYHNILLVADLDYLLSAMRNRNYGMVICGDALQRVPGIANVTPVLTPVQIVSRDRDNQFLLTLYTFLKS